MIEGLNNDLHYKRLAFRGRGGINEIGVQSVTETIFMPAICKPLIALILPGPSPWIFTLTLTTPFFLCRTANSNRSCLRSDICPLPSIFEAFLPTGPERNTHAFGICNVHECVVL